jgi:hypothetical protein
LTNLHDELLSSGVEDVRRRAFWASAGPRCRVVCARFIDGLTVFLRSSGINKTLYNCLFLNAEE